MKGIVLLFLIIVLSVNAFATGPSPSVKIDLDLPKELVFEKDYIIKLSLSPASKSLSTTFYDTPVKVNLSLPNSFDLLDGLLVQEFYFNNY